jgi:hypothetical protein
MGSQYYGSLLQTHIIHGTDLHIYVIFTIFNLQMDVFQKLFCNSWEEVECRAERKLSLADLSEQHEPTMGWGDPAPAYFLSRKYH